MKYLIMFTFTVGLSGCVTAQKPYDRKYDSVDSKTFSYSNAELEFNYIPITASSSIPFTIKNKTSKAMRIIWDETTFINADGNPEKVVHEGVRLLNRNSSVPPSVIPAGATLKDSIAPASKIVWASGWIYFPICGSPRMVAGGTYGPDEELEKVCIGKTFGMYFVYDIDGKKKDFTVKYKYSDRSEQPQKK